VTVAEWKEMATMMGVQNMGGPVTGVLAAFPTPTIERGEPAHSAMQHMQHNAMPMQPDTTHASHVTTDSTPVAKDTTASHAGHVSPDSSASPAPLPVVMPKANVRKPTTAPRKMTATKKPATTTRPAAASTKKGASTKKPAAEKKDSVDHSKMDHSRMSMPPKKP